MYKYANSASSVMIHIESDFFEFASLHFSFLCFTSKLTFVYFCSDIILVCILNYCLTLEQSSHRVRLTLQFSAIQYVQCV